MDKIKKIKLPKHVVIIPDGNRRWARARNKNPWKGHYEGAKAVETILNVADRLDLKCVSIWTSSADNILKRSKIEVAVLLEIFRANFSRFLNYKRIHEKKVRVNIFGRWQEHFPKRVKKPLEKIIEETKNYNSYLLNFFMVYDGIDEMIEVVRRIVDQSKKDLRLKITTETIKKNLFTKDLPPVDLVVRTGVEGDPHNSAGFMMWDTAYSQLYFTETLWPDFGEEEFLKALEDYERRERRMGA